LRSRRGWRPETFVKVAARGPEREGFHSVRDVPPELS
jgi:hypothetical protein